MKNVNVFMERSDSKECKTKLEPTKVKCGANHCKIWEEWTEYVSCTSSW